MSKEKKSFFERLTGTVRVASNPSELDSKHPNHKHSARSGQEKKHFSISSLSEDDNSIEPWPDTSVVEAPEDAELTVDVYQTPESIIIKSMIAGVKPDDLDINITRDMVTITGKREEERIATDDDYFVKELFWGSFSRTISLPEEIDVDEAEAIEKHGLLILKLPKLDKKRQSKLKVRTV